MPIPGVLQFSKRQLPDDVLLSGDVAGAASWRFDQGFIESPDGSRKFFTTVSPFVPDKLMTFKDGVKMVRTTQIILHPPNVVEFIVAPPTGAALENWYLVPNAEEISLWVMDETPGGAKDGLNQDFSTFYPYVSGLIMVYRNGRKLQKGLSLDWVEIDNRTIRLNVAPLSTDFIEVAYMIQV